MHNFRGESWSVTNLIFFFCMQMQPSCLMLPYQLNGNDKVYTQPFCGLMVYTVKEQNFYILHQDLWCVVIEFVMHILWCMLILDTVFQVYNSYAYIIAQRWKATCTIQFFLFFYFFPRLSSYAYSQPWNKMYDP